VGLNMEDNMELIVEEIDQFLTIMLAKHNLDPLILSSVVLARLMLANEYVGSDEDFKKLASNLTTITKSRKEIH
jgi:hypothetical protein